MNSNARPWLQRGYTRVVSLLLAGPLSLIFLVHPAALLDANGHYSHGLISLSMLGMSTGFIHGVGFDPHGRLWRTVFHPLLGWVWMGLGYGLLWQARVQGAA